MRVLVVDDHTLVRNGIVSLLRANNIEVVGEADNGADALLKTRQLKPDMVLMDIKLPAHNGIEATRLIKAEMPDTRIVMLTASDDDEDVFEAVKSGASGYVLKNIRSEEFLDLLYGVEIGQPAISPLVAGKIIDEFARQAKGNSSRASQDDLTEREIEVLKLVADGARNREVAQNLSITENTVKYHLRNIMTKLHLKNRAQMAAYAVSKGLTPNLPAADR